MQSLKLQFRDITSMSLLYKTESTLLPFVGNIVMIEKDQFLIEKVIISFDKQVALCYGKIL